MKFLILTDAQRDAIAKVNAATPDRQLAPVPLPDGRWALNADVLDDPDYWGRHLAELVGCEVTEWGTAGGKVLPLRAGKQVELEAEVVVFKTEQAQIAELDPAKDFYAGADDERVQAEIAARYAAEKARVTTALAVTLAAEKEAVVATTKN